MGMKNVRITTMPMRSQHDVFFQIYHDSFFFAEMPSFQIHHNSFFFADMLSFKPITIISSLPDAFFPNSPQFLLCRDAFFQTRHDSFFFAAMPIFRCITILMIVHQTFLLEMV